MRSLRNFIGVAQGDTRSPISLGLNPGIVGFACEEQQVGNYQFMPRKELHTSFILHNVRYHPCQRGGGGRPLIRVLHCTPQSGRFPK